MSIRTVLAKQVVFISLFLIFIFQPIFAQTLDEKREQAKAGYFSGELEKSLALFQSLSESGDAESQYYIGLIYLTENWSGKDQNKALAYLMSAADQNNAEAMWKIGELHENGLGVDKNLLTAIDWYRKSKFSVIKKSNIMFVELNKDQAFVKNKSNVISELENSAKNMNIEAQYKLAKIYDEGKLIEQNSKKAFYWYHKAAKNNHSYSMLMVGYFLCRGIGVVTNTNQANQWLEKSGRDAQCL